MKRFFTENLPFKIISIVVGLVIYLFVMNDKEGEREFTVPVRVEEDLDSYILLTRIPDLRVVLAGRTRHLTRFETNVLDEIVVELDETKALITFSAADIHVPPGLEVRSVFPETIQLSYAHLTSREVPISVNYHGRPHPDYSITNIRVTPEHVRVTGPEEQIEDLNVLYTSRIDIYPTDIEDIQRRVELITLGTYMDYDRSQPIEVYLDIEPNQETIRVDVALQIRGPSDRYALAPGSSHLSVWLVGPPTLVHQGNRLRIDAAVDTSDMADLEEGRYFVTPHVFNLPEGVRLDRFEPATVPIDVTPRRRLLELTPIPVPVPGLLPIPIPPILMPM